MFRSYYLLMLSLGMGSIFAQNPVSKPYYSELREWSLKGNVRKITVLICDTTGTADRTGFPLDSSRLTAKNTVYYNTAGNIEKVENLRQRADSKSEWDTSVTDYYYSGLAYRSVTIRNGKTTLTSYKKWTGNYSYEVGILDSTGRLVTRNTTRLDSLYRILSDASTYYYGTNDSLMDHTAYIFDPDRHLARIIQGNSSDPRRQDIKINRNLSYDKQGNPTLTIRGSQLIRRTYEYF